MPNHLTVIAGLGNPETRYERTLHNAGFWFVDELARQERVEFRYEKRFDAQVCKIEFAGGDLWLVKPQSYMNLSGGPVRSVLDYYRQSAETLLVAHDEIDLPPGTVKLKKGGGHGGHNGIRDVMQHCGPDFMRLRLGVGHPGSKDKVTGHVLKSAPAEIESALMRNIEQAIATMSVLALDGLNAAMKSLHTKDE